MTERWLEMTTVPPLSDEQEQICRMAASLAGEAAIREGKTSAQVADVVVDAYLSAIRRFNELSV